MVNTLTDSGKQAEILTLQVEECLSTRLELIKIKSSRLCVEVITPVLLSTLRLLFVIIFLLCINIALALLFGEWLGRGYQGFLLIEIINLFVG